MPLVKPLWVCERRHVVGLAFVSGFRHVDDQLSTSGGSSVCLHIVDNHGTYYTICTKTYVVVVAGLTVLGEGTDVHPFQSAFHVLVVF